MTRRKKVVLVAAAAGAVFLFFVYLPIIGGQIRVVTLKNETTNALPSMNFTTGDTKLVLEPISPGSESTVYFWERKSDYYYFSWRSGDKEKQLVRCGYFFIGRPLKILYSLGFTAKSAGNGITTIESWQGNNEEQLGFSCKELRETVSDASI